MKRRLSGIDREEARTVADHLMARSYQGKGYLPDQVKCPTIEEGIVEAVRLSRAWSEVKADILRRSKPFLAFIGANYPAARTWADLRPGMAESYLRHCEGLGLAHGSIRHRLVAVKAAWRRMAQDWPELVKPLPRLAMPERPRLEVECLGPMEVAALLDWLKANSPVLWPMACLIALGGLRVLEAAALRVMDVDLAVGTVTITDTAHHKVKTKYSDRTIPVCAEVIEALKAAISNQRVRPATGEIFTNADGGLWKTLCLSHRLMFTLRRAARDLDNPRLATVKTRKMRASFTTMALRLGCPDGLVQRYLGHAGRTVMDVHYRRVDLDELRTVSDTMGGWRAAFNWKDSGNIPLEAIANGRFHWV